MKKSVALPLLCAIGLSPRAVAAGSSNAPPADLVIVGAGISGLCAALEAARAGAKVAVVDMASVFGGHAVMSSGMVCIVGTPEQQANQILDSPELATEDFVRFGDDANAAWARFYAEHSRPDVYDWLKELSVTHWELYPQIIPGNRVRRQHVARGRGVGLVSPIYRECLRFPNIAWFWNTKVTRLLIESGQVAGVETRNQRTGLTGVCRAGATVLATGGFESNLQLVRAFWPEYFPALRADTRILLGSGIHAQGSGLELATNAGAGLQRLDHQLFYSTGLPDPRDAAGQRGLHAYNRHSIWVNAQGRRFVFDGQPDPKLQMPAVLRQSPATYWAIFDSRSRPDFFVSGSDWNDPKVVEQQIFSNPALAKWIKRADSIEALAGAAGLPVTNLLRTVTRWNEMIAHKEDSEFHRFDRSSSEFPPGIRIPPFFSVQFSPLSRKSLGGVIVDLSCRVLDRKGQPIANLYAVGELTGVGGINGKAALEGTMLGPSILMGRLAAQSIVQTLRAQKPLASPAPGPGRAVAASSRVTSAETLDAWREVLRQLIAQSRPGYLHFEKAHALALARRYDCAQCHDEQTPLAVTTEQLDRRALLRSCAYCHGGVQE